MSKAHILAIIITLFFTVTSCGEKMTADLALINGKIVTVDKNNPAAEAVAIKGDKILAAGSNNEIKKLIDIQTTKIIDLKGKMAVPGFIDAHIHLVGAGQELLQIQLRYVSDISEIQRRVKEKVAESKSGEWILGGGWDHEILPGKKWPTKEIIDPVSPDNPVVLNRIDGHSCLVNSVVLKLSQITKNTPNPPGGLIVKDPVSGEPTGILKETAKGLIKQRKLSKNEQYEYDKIAVKSALKEAVRYGVTGIHHLNENFEIFQELLKNGELTLRVTANGHMTKNPEKLKEYKQWKNILTNNSHMLKFGYLKGFVDGTLGSGTCALFESFSDNPATKGLPRMSQEKLNEYVILMDKEGFQIGLHAIGTKANNMALNAYKEAAKINGLRDSRHRIEHAQVIIPGDFQRFARLGVIASMQPVHCTSDIIFAEKRLGKKRCEGAYAWKSLLNAGVRIAFGTDCPVEPINPMEGLYASVSRKTRSGEPKGGWYPEERLSMEKALELYTLGSAYASFDEKIVGSIEKGKFADIVVLSQDLFKIPDDKIMQTKVVYTIVGGKIIYSSIAE